MSGVRDVGAHVEDMIDACEKILLFTQGLDDADILIETSPLWGSVLHHLVVMGEAAKHVPPAIQARRPQINWRRIAGMRDKLVHYYFGVDAGLVINAVRQSVPEALPQLRSLLVELDA
ncbi:MAG: HepT-like ribonuclease domain-containing protein [Coriobacteriia bacterium]|nr:HepT-like ribonuclease domain-containing protein [Coriobacteriia bacterium]